MQSSVDLLYEIELCYEASYIHTRGLHLSPHQAGLRLDKAELRKQISLC